MLQNWSIGVVASVELLRVWSIGFAKVYNCRSIGAVTMCYLLQIWSICVVERGSLAPASRSSRFTTSRSGVPIYASPVDLKPPPLYEDPQSLVLAARAVGAS